MAKACCYRGDPASFESLSYFCASILHSDYLFGGGKKKWKKSVCLLYADLFQCVYSHSDYMYLFGGGTLSWKVPSETHARTHARMHARTHARTRTLARARAHTHTHTHRRLPASYRVREVCMRALDAGAAGQRRDSSWYKFSKVTAP